MRIRYTLALAVGTAAFLSWLSVFLAATTRGRKITTCPVCRSRAIRHSWPTAVDKVLKYSFVVPFRCENCRKRFYALKS